MIDQLIKPYIRWPRLVRAVGVVMLGVGLAGVLGGIVRGYSHPDYVWIGLMLGAGALALRVSHPHK